MAYYAEPGRGLGSLDQRRKSFGLCRDFDSQRGCVFQTFSSVHRRTVNSAISQDICIFRFGIANALRLFVTDPRNHCEGVTCPSLLESLAKQASRSRHSVSAVIIL